MLLVAATIWAMDLFGSVVRGPAFTVSTKEAATDCKAQTCLNMSWAQLILLGLREGLCSSSSSSHPAGHRAVGHFHAAQPLAALSQLPHAITGQGGCPAASPAFKNQSWPP